MLYLFCIWMESLSPCIYHFGTLPAFKYYFVKPFIFLKDSDCCFPNGWGIQGRNASHNPFLCQYFEAVLAQALISIYPFRSGPVTVILLSWLECLRRDQWRRSQSGLSGYDLTWPPSCSENSAVQWCSGGCPDLKSITSPVNDLHQSSDM